MKCFDDPTRDAVGPCSMCGKGICPEDAVYIGGKLYCKDCAKKVLSGKNKSGKKFYRSRTNKSICGACAGFAEYVDADPTLIRVVWVITTLFTGILPGVIAYFIICIIVPKEPIKTNIRF